MTGLIPSTMNSPFLPPPEIAGDPQPAWSPLVAVGLFALATFGLTIVAPASPDPKADAFVCLVRTE